MSNKEECGNANKPRVDWKIVVSIVALLMTLSGTIYNAGALSNKIEANSTKFDKYVETHAALHIKDADESNKRFKSITYQLGRLMDMTVETQKTLAGMVAVNIYKQNQGYINNGTDKTE